MTKPLSFTFENIAEIYKTVIANGYSIINCQEYLKYKKKKKSGKIMVNRVDIDMSCSKAKRLVDIFNSLNIKATFFIRLHANEYNPFSFENYRIIKFIKESGYEIGYHSEIIDESVIWKENAEDCLRRDIDILNKMFGIQIVGVASHGGFTGLNNLDFWRNKKPSDFGLLYEAYDTQPDFDLFRNSLYVSDSNWIVWKSYNKGTFIQNDIRDIGEHSKDKHPIIYSLIHPETYYDNHFYE